MSQPLNLCEPSIVVLPESLRADRISTNNVNNRDKSMLTSALSVPFTGLHHKRFDSPSCRDAKKLASQSGTFVLGQRLDLRERCRGLTSVFLGESKESNGVGVSEDPHGKWAV